MPLKFLQSTAATLNAMKAARMVRGWTLADLQQASGVDQGTLSRVENEVRAPTLQQALSIAQAFGVRVEELWVVEDQSQRQEQERIQRQAEDTQ